MNSPTRVRLPVVVAVAGLTAGVMIMSWGGRLAWGQAAGAGAATAPAATAPAINANIPPIAATVKAGSAGPADQQLIAQYINAHIGNILSGDPTAMKTSRMALVAGSFNTAQPDASQAYQQEYAKALGQAVLGALGQNKDVRVNLNLAVAVAGVAEKTQDPRLDKVVLAMLAPQQPVPIKLWGLKAAKPIMPKLVTVGGAGPVVKAILAVATQHADDGAMAGDAYEALAPDDPSKLTPTVIGQLVDPLLDLSKQRIAQYAKGLPEEPGTDSKPFSFLSKQGVWDKALSAQQKLRTMQQLCELLTLAAARFDQIQDRAMREQLQPMIDTAIQALIVIGKITQGTDRTANAEQLVVAATAAHNINNTANPVMVDIVKPLCPAISQVKGFQKVVAPPPPGPMPQAPVTKPAGPAVGPAGAGGGAAGAGARAN